MVVCTSLNLLMTRPSRSGAPFVVWVFVCLILLCVQTPVFAGLFKPENTSELVEAFKVAGNNIQDDVIDLGGRILTLDSELVLEPDEGHGLVLRNGGIARDKDAGYFRLLRLVEVPYFIDDGGTAVRLDNMQFRNGFYHNPDVDNYTLFDSSAGGGAVLSHRKTIVKDSSFVNNYVMGNTTGGAISHTKALEISKSFFANNQAFVSTSSQVTHGGAIATLSGASLFVAHSYFLGNSADEGGAIHADHDVTNLNITRSTFDGNKAGTYGGAIWSNLGDGEMRVSNASFIANKALSGGGAIFSRSLFATIRLNHLTFWGNESAAGAGGAIRALIPRDGSNIILRNSIVTNNVGGNCMTTEDEHLSMQHSAYNLVDDDSCGVDRTSITTGIASVFAGKLDNYGGKVPTLPIPNSSMATNLVPREMCLGYDARDIPRLDNGEHQDAFCDAGAFEFVPMEQIDFDGDDVRNQQDNCVGLSNPLQSDIDGDGIGDSCDERDDRDSDGDLVLNFMDNCLTTANFLQIDQDNNGIGDACSQPENSLQIPLLMNSSAQ